MKRLEILKNITNKITDGFLVVDKPKDMTSNDLCQILKKRYNTKSCGHCGTLDPNATGVMILAFGRATKLLSLLDNANKTYLTTILFNKLTDSLDITGNVLEKKDVVLNNLDILKQIDILATKKTQLPPLVSAIKINGKKLYEYARENKEVELKERECNIIDYKIIRPLYKEEDYQIDILLKVSKGYYIRSFARDLGHNLNTYGIVKELRRIAIENTTLLESYQLNSILNEEISLIGITDFLKYDKINIDEGILKYVLNGVTLYKRNLINNSDCKDILNLKRFYIYYNGKPISIYEKQNDIFRPLFKF